VTELCALLRGGSGVTLNRVVRLTRKFKLPGMGGKYWSFHWCRFLCWSQEALDCRITVDPTSEKAALHMGGGAAGGAKLLGLRSVRDARELCARLDIAHPLHNGDGSPRRHTVLDLACDLCELHRRWLGTRLGTRTELRRAKAQRRP